MQQQLIMQNVTTYFFPKIFLRLDKHGRLMCKEDAIEGLKNNEFDPEKN